MLTIRFQPIGRKHRKFYRVVIAQKTRHVSKGCIENLGWYNPYTKEANLNKDRLSYFLKLNVEVSSSVQSLLKKHDIVLNSI